MNISTTPLQKNNLAEKIVGESNALHIGCIFNYLDEIQLEGNTLEKIPGLAYTLEGRKQRVEQATHDYFNGVNIMTHEEFEKKHAAWW